MYDILQQNGRLNMLKTIPLKPVRPKVLMSVGIGFAFL